MDHVAHVGQGGIPSLPGRDGGHDPLDLPGVLDCRRLRPQGIGLYLDRQHVFIRQVVLHDARQRQQPQFAGRRVPIEAVHHLVVARPPQGGPHTDGIEEALLGNRIT